MKKIVLIGPVYPYKGGISHYTGQLYRELSKHNEVRMISYKMQYPKILFKKEQRDYENDSFKVNNTEYMIHTANPFNIIRSAKKIKKYKPDMVIIQWWHPYFAPCYKILQLFMGRQNIIYVCHNVFPHERFPLDKFLTRLVLSGEKHFIVHANDEAKELTQITQDADYRITPHPTYNMFQFEHMTKKDARKRLNIDNTKNILLFFGFVREYKGLKHLLLAMNTIIQKNPHTELWIVGDFDGDKSTYEQIISNENIQNYVKIVDGYTPDREVEKYFAACDLVVLPYESATQSGIVQIAFGFEKPVVVSRVGGLPDVVDDGKTGYICEPCNPKSLADKINLYFVENKYEEFECNIKQEAYRFSWERMSEVIDSFGKE